MSELTTAARPYAKAVFEMARDQGNLSKWSEQLADLAAVIKTDGSDKLLTNPSLSPAQKVDVLVEASGTSIDAGGRNLLKVLGQNNRFALLPEMVSIFEALKSEEEGSIEVEMISAMEVSAEQEQAISQALQKRLGRAIKMNTQINPNLMGGAIIRAGDLVIDGSIQSRLQGMKAALGR